MSRSLIIINYRSAAHAAEAIRTARSASDSPLEIIVVDNSCDVVELSKLSSIGADAVLDPKSNLGYAGGINLGVSRASGDSIIVSNPDVRFGPASIDLLLDHASRPMTLAGPTFFWDDDHRWRMPPSQRMTRLGRVDAVFAGVSRVWAALRNRRRLQSRIRFWTIDRPTIVDVASGAVFAVSRKTFETVGGFDDRFFLYFEEVDFMRRLRAVGGTVIVDPAARCRHLYSQSASNRVQAERLFHESERAFHLKWHGATFLSLASRFGRPVRPVKEPVPTNLPIHLPEGDPGEYLVEASIEPAFDMAAGFFADSSIVTMPEGVLASFIGDRLFMRIVRRATLEVVATWVIDADAAHGPEIE